MSVIAEHPVVVIWDMGNVRYVMMPVTPTEMTHMHSRVPDAVGIPTYYCIEDDDVQWWPSCKDGWPVVGYER